MAKDMGNVVIVGGGIMGCSVAYHLAELGVPSTVVERCAVACGASGKAGGFLARTWCDGGAVGSLARPSFDLHKKYGAMFACDYRPVDTFEVSVNETGNSKQNLASKTEWIDGQHVKVTGQLGDTSNTAQVHPEKLSKCFLDAAKAKGAKLIIGQVEGVEFSSDSKNSVTGVKIKDQKSIPCDLLILTMGPWTNTASQWFQYHLPQIGAQRAHSIVMNPSKPVSAHALFVEYKSKAGKCHDPELYPRPDGTVYMCGFSDQTPLPESASDVTVDEDSVKSLHKMAGSIASSLTDSEVLTEQACYLPLPPDGVPVIGRVPGYNHQVYIAAGHYCWGILNAPATGKSLAELIVNGYSSIDLSPFDPAHFL